MLSIADNRPRIAFWGMGGAFSLPPLEALLAAQADVRAVVVPARTPGVALRKLTPPTLSPIPILNPFRDRGIVQLAWERDLAVWEVGDLRDPAVGALLCDLGIDLACVACWNCRIPRSLLALPRRGWLNVHPSLLPRYRGPAPLFHALRDAAPVGVTIHRMTGEFDAGPILRQSPIALPDGASSAEIDRICGRLGGALLVEAVEGLAAGSLDPQPQIGFSSPAPWPTAADFVLDPCWPARRAFNFMRGTDEWHHPYTVAAGNVQHSLTAAIVFDEDGTLAAPFVRSDNMIAIQFAPGVVTARVG
jgi:methionyl-tRNA formyltransferase